MRFEFAADGDDATGVSCVVELTMKGGMRGAMRCVRCKDAGSVDSSAIDATEDAAARVHSAFRQPVLVLLEVLSRAFFTPDEQSCASLMTLVGSFIGERRGRLGLLAVLAIALTALLSVSASDAATARAKGLDVSNWNGTINWDKVANAGYRFAFGKATEGTGYVDKTYTANRNGSEAAGLVFGAYHFARPAGSQPGRGDRERDQAGQPLPRRRRPAAG